MNFVQFAFVVTVSLLCHVKCENNNLAKFNERAIINGYNAPDRPFYVKLNFANTAADVPKNDFGVCGGTIISPKHVLTAAHCFHDGNNIPYQYDLIEVYVGDMTHPNYRDTVQILSAINATAKVHPGYTGITKQGYDVAIVTLNQTVGNDRIFRMCKTDENFDTGYPLAVCGFGETYPGDIGSDPPQLREAQIHEIDTDFTCGHDKMFNKDLQICTESLPGRTYSLTCEGDSGGPLFPLDGTGVPICLYGTVSFGTINNPMCGDEVVFSRVSAYKDFIYPYIYDN